LVKMCSKTTALEASGASGVYNDKIVFMATHLFTVSTYCLVKMLPPLLIYQKRTDDMVH